MTRGIALGHYAFSRGCDVAVNAVWSSLYVLGSTPRVSRCIRWGAASAVISKLRHCRITRSFEIYRTKPNTSEKCWGLGISMVFHDRTRGASDLIWPSPGAQHANECHTPSSPGLRLRKLSRGRARIGKNKPTSFPRMLIFCEDSSPRVRRASDSIDTMSID
jgi:hypothetical protein